MKQKRTHLKDLAALHALGALDGEDFRAFTAAVSEKPELREAAAEFAKVTEALARSLPQAAPSPQLKDQILRRATQARARARAEQTLKSMAPTSAGGLAFLRQAGASGWVPLPVPGAFVKLLSYDDASGYAVVLGKLEAGARYPAHRHQHAEDIYMLSGDLHVGEELIQAGDFHHAEAGSRHEVNWSENGCVLLAVLSKADLLAQVTLG